MATTPITDWDAFLRRVTGRLASHAGASGKFDRVQKAEPKSAPGTGLTYAIFVSALGPVPRTSGLDATSARLEFTGRIFRPFLAVPDDLIDPNVAGAVGYLIAAYSGDFTLGDEIDQIDLLGAYGAPLGARAGYITLGNTTFRTMDIVIPLIINDAWDQEE